MGFDVLNDEAYKKTQLMSSESGKCRYKNSRSRLKLRVQSNISAIKKSHKIAYT